MSIQNVCTKCGKVTGDINQKCNHADPKPGFETKQLKEVKNVETK